jgi:hypothetical protein
MGTGLRKAERRDFHYTADGLARLYGERATYVSERTVRVHGTYYSYDRLTGLRELTAKETLRRERIARTVTRQYRAGARARVDRSTEFFHRRRRESPGGVRDEPGTYGTTTFTFHGTLRQAQREYESERKDALGGNEWRDYTAELAWRVEDEEEEE